MIVEQEKILGIRFPGPVVAAIEKAAGDNGLNVSSLIRMIVMAWLREKGYIQ